MVDGKTSPSPFEQDKSPWPAPLVALCKAILYRPVMFLHDIHRFSLSALVFKLLGQLLKHKQLLRAKRVSSESPLLGRTRPVLQCRDTIWTGLRSALLRRCGLSRELCCCRSSRRISDSYFLLEMLGSAAPQTSRIKHSRFFPLPARFRCWDGLVFTLSLPAFSSWRLFRKSLSVLC